eukprot:2106272-Amphidinium_carterae.1
MVADATRRWTDLLATHVRWGQQNTYWWQVATHTTGNPEGQDAGGAVRDCSWTCRCTMDSTETASPWVS